MSLSRMTTLVTIGLILAACSDTPYPEAETFQSEAIQAFAPDDTKVRIDACLEEAVQEGKEKFGMTDQEIASEIATLKSDCAILIESDRRAERLEREIEAARARKSAATDEFIRQTEERRKQDN